MNRCIKRSLSEHIHIYTDNSIPPLDYYVTADRRPDVSVFVDDTHGTRHKSKSKFFLLPSQTWRDLVD